MMDLKGIAALAMTGLGALLGVVVAVPLGVTAAIFGADWLAFSAAAVGGGAFVGLLAGLVMEMTG